MKYPKELTKLRQISLQTLAVIDALCNAGSKGIAREELHRQFHVLGATGNFHTLMDLIISTKEVFLMPNDQRYYLTSELPTARKHNTVRSLKAAKRR